MKRQFVALPVQLFFLATLLLAGCNGGSGNSDFLAGAKASLAAGDENAAVIQLKNALKHNPQNPEARIMLGTIYLERQQYADAEKELRRAQALSSVQGLVEAQLVTALLGQREYERLLKEVKQPAIAPPAVQAAVKAGRGRALFELGRHAEAAAAFDEASLIDPGSVEARIGIALLKIYNGQLPQARDEVEQILSTRPDNTDALVLNGDVLALMGQLDKARSFYLEAARVAPNNLEVRLKLASGYLYEGKLSQAADAVAQARKIAPGDLRARHTQALIAFQQGDLQAAQAHIADVLKAAPDFAAANLLAASLKYSMGDFEIARSHLLVVTRESPSSVAGRKLLAATELKLGNISAAESLMQALDPANTEDRGALGLLAEINIHKKDFAAAGRYLERAVLAAPENPRFKTSLAQNWYHLGDAERAVAELESIAAVQASFIQADTALILIHLDANDHAKALDAINKLDKKLYGNPMIHSLRGLTYLGMNDEPGARASFEKALESNSTYFPAAANLASMDMQAGDPQSARARFERILELEQDNQAALLSLAQIAFGNRDENEYLMWLERAAAAKPTAVQPRVLLSRYYLSKGEAYQALSLAQEAAHANPENPQALDSLAVAQLAAKQYDSALVTGRKLVELVPRSHLYHFRLANILVTMGRTHESRAALQRSLALKPDFVASLTALAALEVGLGRHAAAQELAERTQQLFPQAPTGFALEGDNWVAQQEYDKAAQRYLDALQRARSGPIVIKLHAALRLAGKVEEGDAYIQQWLEQSPADAQVRRYFAESLMSRQQHGAGIEQYAILLEQSPGSVIATNNLAWALFQNGDAEALAYAEQAHRMAPANAAVMDTLGWILAQQGQYQRAIDLLRRALEKSPGTASIHYHLAWSLAEAGDLVGARKELRQLLASGADFPEKADVRSLLQGL